MAQNPFLFVKDKSSRPPTKNILNTRKIMAFYSSFGGGLLPPLYLLESNFHFHSFLYFVVSLKTVDHSVEWSRQPGRQNVTVEWSGVGVE